MIEEVDTCTTDGCLRMIRHLEAQWDSCPFSSEHSEIMNTMRIDFRKKLLVELEFYRAKLNKLQGMKK
jgi:hypothetical protein